VRPSLALRTLALAGVALLAALVSLAIARPRHEDERLPQPTGTWYRAYAAPYRPAPSRQRTACGQRITGDLRGIAHPTLPCGAKVYLWLGSKRVLTQVVDRGPYAPGREFDVTKPLADEIGLHRTRSVRWAFAR
jgi:rare lipoprotein A (peptidoglycan hydrolase)